MRALRLGTRIAHRYVIQGHLGEGGLGRAVRVRDLVWDVDLALKVVDAEATSLELLRREFFALRDARHPRLARVHDFGYWRDGKATRAFYTSTLVDGASTKGPQHLRSFAKGRTWEELAPCVGDVLSALASLHRRGLLHGDVHPGNVLVDASSRAVLIDLSCVRTLHTHDAHDAHGTPDGHDAISGTAGFIAPERLHGVVDLRADLYGLGMTLRALGLSLPASASRAVARLVADHPAERPESAEEAAEALGVPWSPPRASDLLGSVFVGRDEARERARAIIDDATRPDRKRGPRIISFTGEDGVGRTRMLEELKADAQLRMNAVLVPGRREGAIATLLAIAATRDRPIDTVTGLVGAVESITRAGDPMLLLVDDADLLSPRDRDRLDMLARSLDPEGPIVLVLASREAVETGDGAARLALSPLDGKHLHAWLRTGIPESALAEIVRATGGYPKEIAALLAQLDGEEWSSRVLARALTSAGASRGRLDLAAVSAEGRDLLAEVALVSALEAAPSSAEVDLARAGLVVRDVDGLRLLRRADASRVSEALGSRAMNDAHRRVLARIDGKLASSTSLTAPERDALTISRIVHLAAVAPDEAAKALASAETSTLGMLRAAADAVLAAYGIADGAVTLRCAEIHAAAGEPTRALSLVARRMAQRPSPSERDALRALAGQCYAQIGDSRRAANVLGRLLPRVVEGRERARVAAALALAHLKRGADEAAIAVAEDALASLDDIDTGLRIDLLLDVAFARARQGGIPAARSVLETARAAATDARPRARFRLASATAFVEYGAGETAAAARAYGEALALAEEHGLDDLVASAALNYGTACHELGDLGRALEAYERGARLATALGMPTTRATLAFDLAKAYADIGSFERAARHAEAAKVDAGRERMAVLVAGACAVLADVALARGDHPGALRHLSEAAHHVSGTSGREVVDVALQKARTLLAAGETSDARQTIDLCTETVRDLGTRDVEAAWLGARGALALAEGRVRDAVSELERALSLAEITGQRALVATLHATIGEAFAKSGSTFLAARHESQARELWEKMLASLPRELHDAFRRHPARTRILGRNSEVDEPTLGSKTSAPRETRGAESHIDVRRILEINRRLNSASKANAVLEETMDAAISLTNAERGFLLVETPERGGSSLKVTVARNVDRETIRQGNLKFSRTVAERVVRTGEPVITVDAAFDPRFTKARSVHAMKLKSLLCVPIRSPEGTLGAIYVDHRFSSGSFAPELVDVLLALGDQAALALVKARLVDALQEKTRELEERNAEVEELARGQALEIARLKRSIAEAPASTSQPTSETTREPAKRRFDYGSMVATSPRMHRVLTVLDRVIDTDVTVLVRGESGTGKERVARAIHANSARSGRPFVAINCGALPESLLEAELFGYRRGAFSGATRDHPGLFVSARGGTLFLDELGEMPASMQVKLLRVLQEREVRPLGSNEAIAVDVRLVCATNRDLAVEVREGRFREDLFYRVAVVDVELPPLRDRIEDVLPLADATLSRLSTDLGRPAARLDRSGERALLAHGWPGNVRELENVLTKAFLLGKSSLLGESDLELGAATPRRGPSSALRARIVATLEETDWNVVVASRALAMPRATLYRKMRKLGIARPERT